MQKSVLLLLFVGAFALGVAFRSFSDLGIAFSLLLVFLGGVLTVVFLTLYKPAALVDQSGGFMGRKQRHFLFVAIFFVAAGLGMLRFDIADLNRGDPLLDFLVGENIILRGVVVEEPDVRESHTKLTVRSRSVNAGRRSQDNAENVTEKVLVIAEHYPEFTYGDEVTIEGEIQKPENFGDENKPGRSFDYVSYLAKDDIYYQMFYPDIVLGSHGQGNQVKAFLLNFKSKLIENTARVLPEPHNSLLAGINLGAKQSLGEELLDAFRATGIIHIVVLSGYNVTIVAESVARISGVLLPRVLGFGVAGLTIAGFAVMTGAGATVVRASIMALLILLARATGRTREVTVALFFAGFAMILWNPKTLMFDPSFQLSFLAAFGLIQLAPRVEKFFGWVPSKMGLREAATATISTQLFVLPLLLYMMGGISLVAPLVNVLILPAIPATMLFGFFTSIAGFVSETVSLPFAYISYAFLEYEFTVVKAFAALPFARVTVSSFPLWAMLGLYAMIPVAMNRRALFAILKGEHASEDTRGTPKTEKGETEK